MLQFVLNRKLKKLSKAIPTAERIYYRIEQKGIGVILNQETLDQKLLKKIRELDFMIVEIHQKDNKIELLLRPTFKIITLLWSLLAIQILILILVL